MEEGEDLHGFTMAGMPLVEVLFSWTEGTGGIGDFLDDQSLPPELPPTVGGRLWLTFRDGVGVPHFAVYGVDVVPGRPVTTSKFTLEGPLSVFVTDLGGGIYSGTPFGTRFSIEVDLVTRNGFLSDGTTATAFYDWGRKDITNDLVLDADTATLLNSLAGTSFVEGSLVDVMEIVQGGALTSGGGEVRVYSGIILDPLALDDEDGDNFPPDPDDVLFILFSVAETDAEDAIIYRALGVVDGPTPAGFVASVQIVNADAIVVALDPGDGEVRTAGNQIAFANFLTQALVAIEESDPDRAIDKLEKAIARTDGCVLRGAPDARGHGRDWITDCAAQTEIYDLLNDALNALLPG